MSKSIKRRHFLVTDGQVRPGVPTDWVDWVGQAIVDYAPDVVINIGDWWDMPSMSMHDQKGSLVMEGARYEDDIEAGNESFARLSAPMEREIKRTARNKTPWKPERHFCFGNHEGRVERAINSDPKFVGCIGLHHMVTNGFRRHDFLQRLWVDGVCYSHYFQAQNSSFPIGGTIDNRLNKIGESFCQGHQQGFLYGNRVYPTGKVRHGLVAGSGYLHAERYKGPQGNKHFRGCVVLNEVDSGDFCVMPLSFSYLCRKYEGKDLVPYMKQRYKGQDWSHLQ